MRVGSFEPHSRPLRLLDSVRVIRLLQMPQSLSDTPLRAHLKFRLGFPISGNQCTLRTHMRRPISVLATCIMIAYVLFRGFTTLLIMPLTSSFFSSGGIYFLLLLLAAVLIAVFSFKINSGTVAALSTALPLITLIYWWEIICKRAAPILTDFYWLVAPEICFSLAVCFRWLTSQRTNAALAERKPWTSRGA